MTPRAMDILGKSGVEFVMEQGAGAAAAFPDSEFEERGARIVGERAEVFAASDIILQVRTLGANPQAGRSDLRLFRKGQSLMGFGEPLVAAAEYAELADAGVTSFALELMPRITRAQSMDALSSMATVAGYKAVLLAADALPRMFPMLMTAAGTITPARVFVLGAGVAGLQAIATARRLGAVVSAYDVRPAVKEQVESLGAKFIQVDLETAQAETKGGYAQALGEEFYGRQRELLSEVVRQQDVVITTAAVPGQKAPLLITRDMIGRMAPGSVVVDLAAERGGNCELTKADEQVVHNGVTILGPTNLAGEVPVNASSLYAKNLLAFLETMIDKKEKALKVNWEDEIIKGTLVAKDGKIVHPSLLKGA